MPEDSLLPYVKNYMTGFNKQFSPEMEGTISLEELERWLKWRTFPPSRILSEWGHLIKRTAPSAVRLIRKSL